jgi:hypothetical protein
VIFLASPFVALAAVAGLLVSLAMLAVYGINQQGWKAFTGWTLLIWLGVATFGIALTTVPVVEEIVAPGCDPTSARACITQTWHGWPFAWLLLTRGGEAPTYAIETARFVSTVILWAAVGVVGAMAAAGLATRRLRPAATPGIDTAWLDRSRGAKPDPYRDL